MDKLFAVLQVIVPIFTTVALGLFTKTRQIMNNDMIQGLQRFITSFCLPCMLFNSCLKATIELQFLTSMVCVIVTVFCGTLFSFYMRKSRFSYHNLPMLFSAQESGSLGIPLFITLFGTDYMFRMGAMDLAQSFVAIPVIALLSTTDDSASSPGSILKSALRSPLLIASLAELILNLTGIMDSLNTFGCGQIISSTTSFLAQPVSAAMIFCVGYNFTLGSGNRKDIFQISAIHLLFYGFFGALTILILKLTHSDIHNLWAAVMFWTLPSSYLAPGLGRKKNEAEVASGIVSLLTIISLVVFCLVAICNI